MPITELCRIAENRELNPGTYSMLLEAPNIAAQAKAGQFVNVKCGAGLLLRRPISICDADAGKGTLRMVFEVRGEGTAWLAERTAGETVDVLGPLGHGYEIPEGKVLVVGGGIGVPPMLYAARCCDSAVAALGFRNRDKVILTEEFGEICEKVDLISDDGTTGRKGFVNLLVKEALTRDPEISAVFACGPKMMLKTVVEAAKEANVPCQVSMEERMGCGIGACLVCACKIRGADGEHYKHVCKDGPVFKAEEVCWDE